MGVFGEAIYGHDGYGDTDNMFITDRTETDLRNNAYKVYLNPEHMQWLYTQEKSIEGQLNTNYPTLNYNPSSSAISYLYIDDINIPNRTNSTSANKLAEYVTNLVSLIKQKGYTYNPEFEIPDTLDKADIYTVNNLERALYDMTRILTGGE